MGRSKQRTRANNKRQQSPGIEEETVTQNEAERQFKEFVKSSELTAATISILAQHGFVSLRALKELTSDIIEAHFTIDLPLAQTLLLKRAIVKLTGSTSPESGSTSTLVSGTTNQSARKPAGPELQDGGAHSDVLSASDIAKLLQLPDPVEAGRVATDRSSAYVYDPFNSGTQGNILRGKYRDICDFVSSPHRDNTSDESFELRFSDGKLNLNSKKPTLDRITQMQYMEASLKILRLMALEDNVPRQVIMEYIGYIIKISTLSQSFVWQSVLQYDHQYRKQQSELQFPWGADNSYMLQLHLVKRDTAKSSPTVPQGSRNRQRQGEVPICLRWNSRQGCTLLQCKFSHVCSACFSQTHPFHQHGQPKDSRTTQPHGARPQISPSPSDPLVHHATTERNNAPF